MLHLVGTGALTGALLLGSAPVASADDIRERQWALNAFAAEDIWAHATGKGVTVAVVDTGLDSHPDLKGAIVRGKDYTQGKGNSDNGSHGTAMSSLIAARGHGPGNKLGMKGLAPGSKIMPITVPTASTYGKGIRYAVDHGAKVVNLSYGGPRDEGDRKAVEYAISKDVVVVAATGNTPGKHKEYPAAYPGVVSVGGLGRDGTLWEGSSWGSNTTLVAPAEKNLSASPKYKSGYAIGDGTSDAAAYVSAAAALVREKHPDLTAGQVINRLIKSAKPLTDAKGNAPKLPDEKFGYGVVRPFRAVTSDYAAGPKAGPLAQPEKSSDSAAGSTSSDSGSSSSDDSSGWMYVLGPPIVLFGLILVVLIGVAVVIVVLVKRKDSRDRVSDPWGSGNGPTVPGQQYPGQQPHAPAGQFGGPPTAPPPPPNQPPSR
ncbi:S8 family serine peptidase [Streptomyces bathyalis]|uniref:S8 family serine peptidase n=1 Tax=Streptomyces bathyalis TaxID=2710756 RepID=A0A7T1WSY6_9ACTN|nr:S8 family serine peptidase [Streptomyces bathyalis]QPP06250.1 S8 family serine peptidase [Streptomyces bathyalis]